MSSVYVLCTLHIGLEIENSFWPSEDEENADRLELWSICKRHKSLPVILTNSDRQLAHSLNKITGFPQWRDRDYTNLFRTIRPISDEKQKIQLYFWGHSENSFDLLNDTNCITLTTSNLIPYSCWVHLQTINHHTVHFSPWPVVSKPWALHWSALKINIWAHKLDDSPL